MLKSEPVINHIAMLDGARGIAFLSVFLFHLHLRFNWHWLVFGLDVPALLFTNRGIHLFFALSGYLLFKPLVKAINNNTDLPDLTYFAQRRFLRIFPAYLFYIFAITGLALLFQRVDILDLYKITLWQQLTSHILMLHIFSAATLYGLEAPWWSQAVEFHFYIFLGVTIFVMGQFFRKHLSVKTLLYFSYGGIGLSVFSHWAFLALDRVLSWFGHGYITGDSWVFNRNLPALLYTFACGFLLAIYLHADQCIAIRKASHNFWSALIGTIGLLLLSNLHNALPKVDYFLGDFLHSLAWSLILFALLNQQTTSNSWLIDSLRRIFSWQPFVSLGLISYSCYLVHDPLIKLFLPPLLEKFGHSPLTYSLGCSLILPITIIISTITFHYIEKPCMQLGIHKKSPSTHEKGIPT